MPDLHPIRPFETEFPVKAMNSQQFIDRIVDWFNDMDEKEGRKANPRRETLISENDASLKSDPKTGESLSWKRDEADGKLKAIGFLHTRPDPKLERKWVTECVLSQDTCGDEQYLLRLRTHAEGEKADVPAGRPNFIKLLLKQGWGGNDGMLEVSVEPTWLKNTPEDIKKACALILGTGTRHLPMIYIASTSDGAWDLEEKEIEDFALSIGGAAHVVVEPNREFSHLLKHKCDNRNPYDGTVGLILPELGISRKYFIDGDRVSDGKGLINNLRGAALGRLRQMAFSGWDWDKLDYEVDKPQEIKLEKDFPSDKETEFWKEYATDLEEDNKKLQGTISKRDETIDELKAELRNQPQPSDEQNWVEVLVNWVGLAEIYEGELSDHLRRTIEFALLKMPDNDGDKKLWARTEYMIKKLSKKLKPTKKLNDLNKRLKKAEKADKKRYPKEVGKILTDYGYEEKSEKNHLKYTPRKEYQKAGLEGVTIGKTPSDNRASRNSVPDIKKAMGFWGLLKDRN